jgi:hypothetical protein
MHMVYAGRDERTELQRVSLPAYEARGVIPISLFSILVRSDMSYCIVSFVVPSGKPR